MDKTSLSGFKRAPFSAVFEEKSRGVRKIKQKDYLQNGYHPIIDQGQNEIAGYCNEEEGLFLEVPAIVFGDHTRCIKYVQKPFFAGADGVKILKPKLSDNVRFWYHALKATRIENLGYSRHFKLLKQSSFRIYDHNREKCITERLDCIQSQIEVAKRQTEWLDTLVKSQFVEMFGDIRTNAFGWPIRTFEDISELITDGEHATPKRQEDGIYLLSARNVKNHTLDLSDVDFIGEDEYKRIARRIIPQEGDVLISCSGTIGRCCVVPPGVKFQMVRSAALIRFTNRIDPIFAEWLIASSDVQEQIKKSATQSSQANLFQGRIKKLKGIVPPLDLQQEFAAFVAQVDKSKSIARKQIEKLQLLYDSLAQEYFGD